MIPLIKAVMKHKKAVILVTLSGFVISALISLVIPKRFISYGSFLPAGVERELSSGSSFFSALGEFGQAYSELVRVRRNFIIDYIIRSRRMGLLMDKRFDLSGLYGIDDTEKLLRRLNRNTSVLVRDEGVIVVGVEDEDPVRARNMVAYYFNQLDSLLIDIDVGASRGRIEYLDREIGSRMKKVAAADSMIKDFMERNGLVDIGEQVRGAYELLAELKKEQSVLDIEKSLLELTLSENAPDYERLEARVSLLDEKITELMEGRAAGKAPVIPSMRDVPELAAEYMRLVMERKIQEFAMAFMRLKLEDAKLTSARDVSVIRIIDPPYVPERRIWPKRKQIVMISTFSALFAACIVIAALDSRKDTEVKREKAGRGDV